MDVFKELQDDLRSLELPKDIGEGVKKVKCALTPGLRIYWFFKEDEEFCTEYCDGEDPHDNPGYSGLLVPAPDCEMRGGELEWEDCVVVQDRYPAEKCYCEATYIAFNRLLDADGLVEIFAK